jgi:phage replication O-like protein O
MDNSRNDGVPSIQIPAIFHGGKIYFPEKRYTQVPNALCDEIQRQLSGSEFKILMTVWRKTVGWHKVSDRIPISQLMELTGLSNRVVIAAGRSLARKGLLRFKPGSRSSKGHVGRPGEFSVASILVLKDAESAPDDAECAPDDDEKSQTYDEKSQSKYIPKYIPKYTNQNLGADAPVGGTDRSLDKSIDSSTFVENNEQTAIMAGSIGVSEGKREQEPKKRRRKSFWERTPEESAHLVSYWQQLCAEGNAKIGAAQPNDDCDHELLEDAVTYSPDDEDPF